MPMAGKFGTTGNEEKMMRYRTHAGAALLLVVSLSAGCDSAGNTLLAPDAPLLAAAGSTLIECPVSETRSATKTLGLLGGKIELDGHSMTVPAGAIASLTTFTLTAPKSNYMEIEIHAQGADSFEFLHAVSITISYDRCTRSNINQSALTAWYIDSATKTLIEDMEGTDDKLARTVTFDSDHLSGFAIAN